MRRMLQFIALLLLALSGQAGVLRSAASPAQVSCLCGCGAPSSLACACKSSSLESLAPACPRPDGAMGAPCWAPPRAPGNPRAALAAAPELQAAPATAPGDPINERTVEAKPWPAQMLRPAPRARPLQRTPPPEATGAPPGPRKPDSQAQLSIFRI